MPSFTVFNVNNLRKRRKLVSLFRPSTCHLVTSYSCSRLVTVDNVLIQTGPPEHKLHLDTRQNMERGTIACSKKKLRTVICDREDVAWLVAETDRRTDKDRDNICKPRSQQQTSLASYCPRRNHSFFDTKKMKRLATYHYSVKSC